MRDEIRKVIRDAFLSGDDDRAIEFLNDEEYRNSLGRRTILPMNFTYPIGVGQIASIVARPQIPIKISRLLVSIYCADRFTICDIKKGYNSYLPQAGELAADLFQSTIPDLISQQNPVDGLIEISLTERAERLTGIAIDMEVANVAEDIILVVRNISGYDTTFYAGFLCCVAS